jgi:FtsP/CotA-like multicopper oxidase with cupredoxin domain
LYTTITYLAINSERPKGTINHTSWSLTERLASPLLAIDRDEWPGDPAPFIPSSDGAEWVDIVINNVDDNGHPFHFHGNDFFVIGYHAPDRIGAYDLYNPFDDSKEPAGGPMNLINPPKKDTVYVPSMGYVVLRFQASSPGLWLLHCHVLWHQSVGMAMAIQVGDTEDEAWTALAESSGNSCNG